MSKHSDYFYEQKSPSFLTQFFWWCAGADKRLLMQCTYSDHVKYFGLGGIVFATGLLAAISGGYAFYTIFSPKDIQGALSTASDLPTVMQASVFGLIWGLIIFNLDRFIISSTGKGDGTEKITGEEFMNAIPRIIMALILSIAIAAPLEIRIFQTEIDAELFKIQKEKIQELNDITDSRFSERIKDATANKEKLEKDISTLTEDIRAQRIKLQEEVAGRVGSGREGYGPSSKQIELNILVLEGDLQKLESRHAKRITDLDINIEDYKNERAKEYKENVNQAKKLDGLLQRILIAEEVAGLSIIWLIRLIFIVIETGPIFFKMMVIKSAYDFLEENLKEEIIADAGLVARKELHIDKKGKEVVKYVYTSPKQILNDKMKLFEAQKELSQYIIDKWKEEEKAKIDKNPEDYITTIKH